MKSFGKGILATAVLSSLAASAAFADTSVSVADVPVDFGFAGFVRADYGNGDRYSSADGEQRFGTTKSLFLINMNTEDVHAVLDFGATILTDTNSGGDASGTVGFKDAFIVIGDAKPTGFSFSVGAQPLLFGLHPNGYPGDSSLQANIDYGAIPGAFNVSQQAGPSIVGNYKFTPDLSVRFGAAGGEFTGTPYATNLNLTNGSKVQHNVFVLLRGNNIAGLGLYATAGYESIFVGGPYDGEKPIYSVGVGYKQDLFDVSVEYIHLNQDIIDATLALTTTGIGTQLVNGDERYIRVHASVSPIDHYMLYADYSNAHELGANTFRIGGQWQFRKHLNLMLEYSRDDYSGSNGLSDTVDNIDGSTTTTAVVPNRNVQSVDARLTFTF
jgi:hypothetical protein